MKISIKEKLARIIGWIRTYLKETSQLPYFRLYLILIPLFLFFFLLATFPFDAIVRRSLQKMENHAFRNVSMDELEVPFFGMWSTRQLTAGLKNGGDMTIREANLDISIMRALAGRYIGGFQMTGAKIKSPSWSADMNGSCNFDLKTTGQKSMPVNGTVRIILDNVLLRLGTVTLPENMGGFPLEIPLCKITALMIRAELKGSRISLREATVSGNDLRGTVTGSIETPGTLQNANLDLMISLDSDSAVLTKFRPFLSGMTSGGKVDFSIRGTISHPKVESLKGSRDSTSSSEPSAPGLLPGIQVPGSGPDPNADDD